jgi:Neprosin
MKVLRHVVAAVATVLAVGFAVFATAAQALPKGVRCIPATPANEVTPPPPLWQLKHEAPPANPPQPLCPGDSVPTAAPAANGSISPGVAPPVTASPKPNVPVASPTSASETSNFNDTPAFGGVSPLLEYTGYPTAPYYYAGDGFHTPEKWYGISAEFEVGNPKISSPSGTHSLGQIAAGTPNAEYTSEMGWIRSEGMGSGSRLFIYINKDHYKSNGEPGGDCYNCVTPQVGAPYTQNQELTVGKTYQFTTAFYGKRWWYAVGESWIGYEPESFWSSKFTSATWLTIYGEVYDSTGPNSQMGNGTIGTKAGSLVTGNPYLYYEGGDKVITTAGHKNPEKDPYPNDIPGYNVGQYSANERLWHYGGE